jgi:hypothetical protein
MNPFSIKMWQTAARSFWLTLALLTMGTTLAMAEANYVYHEATTAPVNGVSGTTFRSLMQPNSAQTMTIGFKSEFQYYTNQAWLYYTNDGSTPSGAFGTGSGTTQVVAASFVGTFGGAGTVDICTATIPAQAAGKTVKYIVSSWNNGGGDEIFANGPGSPCSGCGAVTNNSGLATVFSYTVLPLIDPNGAGGFELGSTFAANGWTAVNAATNEWSVGTATFATGANSAYISNTAGATYAYSNTTAAVSHFYRDVTVPAGQGKITLTFKLKGDGDLSSGTYYDKLMVYTAPTTFTPVNTAPASSGTALAGATLAYAQAANYGAAYTTVTVSLPAALAGTTFRLIFTWHNDGSTGTVPASVDDIALTAVAPVPICNAGGPYTIDNTLPNSVPTGGKNFSSFTNAINHLNIDGICGPLTLNVAAGQTFNENPPALTATGTSANAIIFLKSGTGANPKITPTGTAGTADFGFCIQGGDYITIDGIDIDASAAAAAVEYGFLVRNASATDGAQNNTIQNTAINMGSRTGTLSTSYGIFQTVSSTGGGTPPTAASGANSTNKYYNFAISNVRNGGIYLLGNVTLPDLACEIGSTACATRSTIMNVGPTVSPSVGAVGVLVSAGSGTKVFHTDISAIAGNQAGTQGIYINNMLGNSEIYNNTIKDISVFGGTASASSVHGIFAQNSTTGTNNIRVYNNAISNLTHSRTTASATRYVFGIFTGAAGAAATQSYDVDNNSVSIGQTLNIAVSSACYEVQNNASVYRVRGNIFANYTAAQGALARHYAVRFTGATWGAAGSVLNFNDYYVPNDLAVSGFISLVGTATNNGTLAAHTAALTSPAAQDANSVLGDPGFTNPNTDLHASGAAVNAVASFTPQAWITNDMDCALRSGLTPSDLGSDAFTPAVIDMGVTALVNPAAPGCTNATQNVTVTVKNFSALANINFSVNPVTVTVNVTGALTQTLTATLNSGTLAMGATQNVSMGSINMTAVGTYTFNANTSVVGEGNTPNDAMAVVNRTLTAPVSLPTPVLDFTGFTGSNLNTLFPQWNESTGATVPAGTTSAWNSSTIFGSTTARLNLYTTTRVEWLAGPKVTVGTCTKLRFKAAVTDFGGTVPITDASGGMAGTDDAVKVMVSTDCGATYTPLYTMSAAMNMPPNTGVLTDYSVDLSALYAGQQITIGFLATDGPIDDLNDYEFHLDDIQIYNEVVPDVTLNTLTLPASACTESATSTVTVKLKNSSAICPTLAIGAATVTLAWTGAASGSLNLSNTTALAPGAEETLTFTGIDLSADGVYNFTATAVLPSEIFTTNNSATGSVTNLTNPTVSAAVNTTPICLGGSVNLSATAAGQSVQTVFTENFETGAAGWVFRDSSSTAATAPVVAASIFHIENAPLTDASGSATFSNFTPFNGLTKFAYANADVTGSSTYFTNTFLVSPVVSTVNYTTGNLEFDHLYQKYTTGDIAAQLEYSTDGGTTWKLLSDYKTLGSQGVTTSNAQVTTHATVALPAACLNQASIKFQFKYKSNWGFVWAIDNVKLSGLAPDVPPVAWSSSPATGGLSAAAITSLTANAALTAVTPTAAGPYTYTVTATAQNTCTASAIVALVVNALPTLTTTTITNTCIPIPTTTVDLNTGITSSTAGLTIQFYTDNTFATEITGAGITAAATGTTYYVKATNATTTCTATAAIITTTTNCCTNPVITSAVTNVACFGGVTGSITLTQTGGDAITSYAWTGSSSTTATVSGLVAGTYSVTVTAGVGCTAALNMISVTEPTAALTLTQVSTDNTACGTPNGTATFTAAGGTTAYTYATTAGTAFMVDHTTKTAAHPEFGVGSGNGYTIDGVEGKELTLVRGVTYTFDATMVGGSHPFYITDDANGGGGGAGTQYTTPVVGTMIMFTPTAAMPNLLYYQCSNHSNMGWKINLVTPTSASDLTGLAAGSYTTVVTDANGCMATATATVVDNITPVTATLSNDGPLTCTKTSVTLSATGAGTYAYSAGPTGITSPATYTVTVTATNGCMATASTEVLQDIATPMASLSKSGNLTCAVTSVTLTAATGAEYDFGGGFAAANTTMITMPNTYIVTVKGANGCTATASVIVTASTTPPVANVMGNLVFCTGLNTTLLASPGFATYTWSGGTAGATINKRIFNMAGTYSVVIVSANGCAVTKAFTIVENSKPTLTGATIPTICQGSTLMGSVTVTSALPATTTWTGSSFTATGTTMTRPSATTAMSGTYIVRAVNTCGTTSAAAVATVKANLPITVALSNANVLGGSTGTINVTAPANCTFSWADNASITVGQRNNLPAGVYVITITPPLGSVYCAVTRTIVVN